MASYAYEAITVSSTAIGFTEANINNAIAQHQIGPRQVLCTLETNPIRVRFDGGAPTTSVGHLVNVGDVIKVDGTDARQFRAIATGSDASLKVTYEYA